MRHFTARFATDQEIDNWDDHVTSNPNGGNLLQSASFASVKSAHGWKPVFMVYEGVTEVGEGDDVEEREAVSYTHLTLPTTPYV